MCATLKRERYARDERIEEVVASIGDPGTASAREPSGQGPVSKARRPAISSARWTRQLRAEERASRRVAWAMQSRPDSRVGLAGHERLRKDMSRARMSDRSRCLRCGLSLKARYRARQ